MLSQGYLNRLTLLFQDNKYLLCQPVACIQEMIPYKGGEKKEFSVLKDFLSHKNIVFKISNCWSHLIKL